MERNHKFVGLCLETQLRGNEEDPVALSELAREMRVSVDEVRRSCRANIIPALGDAVRPSTVSLHPKPGSKYAQCSFIASDAPIK